MSNQIFAGGASPIDDALESGGQVQARTSSIDSLLDEIDSVLDLLPAHEHQMQLKLQ